MGLIKKMQRSLKRDGVLGMVRLCFRNLTFRKRSGGPPCQFDIEYGIETDRFVELSDLEIDSPNESLGVAYQPTPTWVFDKIMAVLPAPESYHFIDLGSGKGRVVLMAARQPFKSVTGVEFSPELCAVAETNLARFKPHVQASEVRIVCKDASLFEFPPGPLIVYCYFAFAREVLVKVLANLARRQDETIFVYYNAHFHELFADSELLHQDDLICMWKLGKSAASARK